MKRLDLDYTRAPSRARFAAYALAVVAAAFATDVGLRYHSLWGEIALREARLASRPPVSAEPAASLSTAERTFARDTVKRLATPWGRLFDALESAQTAKVVLVSVEPDVENRVLRISGEAQDYLAVLSYVANLSEQRALRQVHLVRHEARKTFPRSLTFQVSAAWGGP